MIHFYELIVYQNFACLNRFFHIVPISRFIQNSSRCINDKREMSLFQRNLGMTFVLRSTYTCNIFQFVHRDTALFKKRTKI